MDGPQSPKVLCQFFGFKKNHKTPTDSPTLSSLKRDWKKGKPIYSFDFPRSPSGLQFMIKTMRTPKIICRIFAATALGNPRNRSASGRITKMAAPRIDPPMDPIPPKITMLKMRKDS